MTSLSSVPAWIAVGFVIAVMTVLFLASLAAGRIRVAQDKDRMARKPMPGREFLAGGRRLSGYESMQFRGITGHLSPPGRFKLARISLAEKLAAIEDITETEEEWLP